MIRILINEQLYYDPYVGKYVPIIIIYYFFWDFILFKFIRAINIKWLNFLNDSIKLFKLINIFNKFVYL